MPVSFGRTGVGLGSYYGNRLVSPYTGVVLLDGRTGKIIGGIRDFTISSSRRTDPIRFVDLFNAGRIFEQALQPEEVTMRATSVLFYFDAPVTPSAPDANTIVSDVFSDAEPGYGVGEYSYAYTNDRDRSYYGTTSVDRLASQDVVAPGMFLNVQFVPFDIIAFIFNPSRQKGIGYRFLDCYVTSYSSSFRIETAFVAEDVDIKPTSWDQVQAKDVLDLLGVNSDEFNKYLYLRSLTQ